MAKSKNSFLDSGIDSLSGLYDKYNKTGMVQQPPEDLSKVNFEEERLITPFLHQEVFMGGGPALGKITTFSGMFSTGKTSEALAVAGANPNAIVGFVDAEFNWVQSSYVWAYEKFGINPANIIVLQPDYQEQAAEMVADLCDVADIIIFDGFDMLAPLAEYEDSMESNKMGLMARTYKQMFRKMMGKVYRTKTAFMITNHLYENIGNVFEPYKEPGGKSIGDFPSQKYFLTRSQAKDNERNVVGQWVNHTVNKDKLTGQRGRKFSILYNNDTGFDFEQEILDLGVEAKVLKKSGSWWAYEGESIGQGDEKTKSYLRDNPETKIKIRTEIIAAYKKVEDARKNTDQGEGEG